ncbi:MAG: cytochrome P450 [Deltaproteobacteria bacterium]|nr:cytochrome P450 [Deltaproteobacteria bacterium]MBI3388209.1 cytochrome P450 [Deltaproteobacteria bacterium]
MTAAEQTFDPATLDLITPEHYEQNGYPHPEWTWLRRHDPVFWYDRSNVDPFWAITKHADIIAIGKQPELFLNAPRLAVFTNDLPPPPEGQSRHLLNMDPPDHNRYRRISSGWFTPRAIRAMDGNIERVTREVLDAAAEKEEGDFVRDISAKITIAVIAEMLGVPRPDWDLLFRWTNEIIAPQDPEFQHGATPTETIERSRIELFTYFHDLATRRRSQPSDDIVSVIANAQMNDEPLPPVELLSYFFLLVVAGNETTRNAMTGGMLALLDHPDEWEKLRHDPARLDGAVEEIVRWTTPVIQFARTATRDTELRGKTIRTGQSVCLFYGSGNRDDEVFQDPFTFRIDREPNPHIGFGMGEHVCLGAHLARLELRHAFGQLRARLERCELSGPVARVRSSFVGGIKRAPMRWRIAPAHAATS